MANSIIMPKTGMAMEEGMILEWHIKTGDKISKGDVVALIETDKATMELESDYDGIILSILNKAGETVPVTKVIAWIGQEGETIPAGPATVSVGSPDNSTGAGTVAANSSSNAPAEVLSGKVFTAVSGLTAGQEQGIRATPAARTLAKEHGIDLHTVVPNGRNGEIRKAAVEQAAYSAEHDRHKRTGEGSLPDKRVPLTNIQKITGRRMSESRQTIPEVTSHIKADVTDMLLLREELNKSLSALDKPGKITINDFVLAATIKVLLAYPRLNSLLDGNDLIYKGSINLGMATSTKRGLVVPVIHNAQDYSLINLSLYAAELAAKAREGSLKTEEMTGGTFTVSNIGMYGIASFTPIINPPEAAILGVCAVEDVLKLDGEQVVNRKIIGLSLAFDHRIVDGAESSMFLKEIKDTLEAPLLILL
ncbi:MAG: 2-oxo acid dehydrogenase subunit E2 [Treponema sp.]|nr:2-oxo acid dehydrogenase subunit E2 [Treponema sp.]